MAAAVVSGSPSTYSDLDVVALNNQAVTFVDTDHETSVTILRTALQNFVQQEQARESPENDEDASTDSEQRLPEIIGFRVHGEEGLLHSTARVSLVQSCFARPIRLIPSESTSCRSPLNTSAFAFGVVIFNLALLFHRKSFDLTELEARRKLATARSLYVKSQQVLSDLDVREFLQSEARASIELIIMAILNNLSQIALIFSESEEARRQVRELLAFADHVHPEAYQPETAYLLRWYKACFVANSQLCLMSNAAEAA